MQNINLSISTDFIGKLDDTAMYKAAVLEPATMSVDAIRRHLAVDGHAICCAELKTNAAGQCRRKIDNYVSAQMFGVDVDHGGAFDELRLNVYLRQHAAFAYTTASHTAEHPRYRIMFVMERPESDPERYKRLVSIMSDKFGGDQNARDAVRIWYGSPDAHVVDFGGTLSADEVARIIDEDDNARPQIVRYETFRKRTFTHADLQTMLNATPSLMEHLEYKRFIAGVFNTFGPDPRVFDMLQAWSPSKVSYQKWYQNRMTRIGIGTSIYIAKTYGRYEPPANYLRDDPKTAAESHDHVESYLLSVARYRRNIIKAEVEFNTSQEGGEWERVDDHFVNTQLRQMTKLKIKTTKEKLWDVLRSDFAEDHDDLVSYFSNLEPWDADEEIDYIDALAAMIPPVDDTIETPQQQREANVMILTRWLIAAYRCAVLKMPNHIMLVLQGSQGTGKTRLLRHLCPWELRRRYFYEGEFGEHKDIRKRIYTSFIAVDDELGGMNKSSLESLKSLITKDYDELRLPYDRTETAFERIVSFAGTVNERNFLTDHTGNRRFAPIPVGGLIRWRMDDVVADLEAFPTDRMWAQVMHMAMQSITSSTGITWIHRSWFDEADMKMLALRQDDFQMDSYTDELVRQWIVPAPDALPRTATELLFELISRLPIEQQQRADSRLQWQFQRSLKRAGIPNGRKKTAGSDKRGYRAKVRSQSEMASSAAKGEEGLF